jgi:hypothetical protein
MRPMLRCVSGFGVCERDDFGALLRAHAQALRLRRVLACYPPSEWRDDHEALVDGWSARVAAELTRREMHVQAACEHPARVLIG